MRIKPKFERNMKLVLPYENKQPEYLNIVKRNSNKEIKIFKVNFIRPPILFKKDFDKNIHSKQYSIMKAVGYSLSVGDAEFTDEGIIYHRVLFSYKWIDSLVYYHYKES